MMEHAHELPEFLHFLEEINILRGFVFGFTHTLIPLIGFYSGWSINRLLKCHPFGKHQFDKLKKGQVK